MQWLLGDLRKNNVGRMLTVKCVTYLRENGTGENGSYDYKQSFQKFLLHRRNRDSCWQAKWVKQKVLRFLSFLKLKEKNKY